MPTCRECHNRGCSQRGNEEHDPCGDFVPECADLQKRIAELKDQVQAIDAGAHLWVMAHDDMKERAEKAERERDDAREEIQRLHDEELSGYPTALDDMRCERDEARARIALALRQLAVRHDGASGVGDGRIAELVEAILQGVAAVADRASETGGA